MNEAGEGFNANIAQQAEELAEEILGQADIDAASAHAHTEQPAGMEEVRGQMPDEEQHNKLLHGHKEAVAQELEQQLEGMRSKLADLGAQLQASRQQADVAQASIRACEQELATLEAAFVRLGGAPVGKNWSFAFCLLHPGKIAVSLPASVSLQACLDLVISSALQQSQLTRCECYTAAFKQGIELTIMSRRPVIKDQVEAECAFENVRARFVSSRQEGLDFFNRWKVKYMFSHHEACIASSMPWSGSFPYAGHTGPAGSGGAAEGHRTLMKAKGRTWPDLFLLLAAVQADAQASKPASITSASNISLPATSKNLNCYEKVISAIPLVTDLTHATSPERPARFLALGDASGKVYIFTPRGDLLAEHNTGAHCVFPQSWVTPPSLVN
eukprot:scaffold83218_cov21-Tisochrysis_lutea.AAC.1